jgi:hypothetical protein
MALRRVHKRTSLSQGLRVEADGRNGVKIVAMRRLLVILCLAALLIAAVTPSTSFQLLAVLVPLLVFFAVPAALEGRVADERPSRARLAILPVFSSRLHPAR